MKNAMKPPRQESTHNKSEMNRDKKGKKNNRASMVPAFTRKKNKKYIIPKPRAT